MIYDNSEEIKKITVRFTYHEIGYKEKSVYPNQPP